LESYERERAGAARLLLRQDAALTGLAFLDQPLLAAVGERITPYLTRHPRVQRFVTGTAAGLRISYRHGPLSLDGCDRTRRIGASRPQAGSRAPDGLLWPPEPGPSHQLYDLLSGTSHALLLFLPREGEDRWSDVQSALSGWQDLVEVYPIRRSAPVGGSGPPWQAWYDPDGALARSYGIGDEGLVLVRPDGHIAFRSRPIVLTPLQRYLSTHFQHEQVGPA
jgi:hypothetical protein